MARRFPIIVIDEAQDSSRIQIRIIDTLIRAGVTEVMLAGDPYQAIYEWRQAEPQLFEDKFSEWEDNYYAVAGGIVGITGGFIMGVVIGSQALPKSPAWVQRYPPPSPQWK